MRIMEFWGGDEKGNIAFTWDSKSVFPVIRSTVIFHLLMLICNKVSHISSFKMFFTVQG